MQAWPRNRDFYQIKQRNYVPLMFLRTNEITETAHISNLTNYYTGSNMKISQFVKEIKEDQNTQY